MRLKSRARWRGFTLIEMVVVISLIMVLLSIALPMYSNAILRSKEARLRNNLKVLNDVIQQYSLDNKKAPLTLQDLVDKGYLKSVPEDITGSNTTWVTENEDPEKAWDPNQTGITSVHSGSDQMASNGTQYSTW